MSQFVEEFKWGKPKADRGLKKDVQFYESFTYDGVEYFLYDCVYLYAENEPEPYIGKLVKIWKHSNGKRRIRVVWFFRPVELLNWVGDAAPLKNEIFLACGEGVGLSNVNQPEVLVGKCNVLCSSKDKRNPQPSDAELKMADYFFFRTFDVGTFTISDKIGDKIAGFDVKYYFNRLVGQERVTGSSITLNSQRIIKENETELLSMAVSLKAGGRKLEDSKLSCVAVRTANGDKLISRCKNAFSSDGAEENISYHHKVKDNSGLTSNQDLNRLVSLENTSLKKRPIAENSAELSERVDQIFNHTSVHRQNEGNLNVAKKQKAGSDRHPEKSSRLPIGVKDFDREGKSLLKKVNPLEKEIKLPADADIGQTQDNSTRKDGKVLDVTRKPQDDRSKWFKLPWEDRLQHAYERGSLVLLQNLDPSYLSSEVEDIMWSSFQKKCIAKVIHQSAYSSPHNGQAYAIFESREVAEMVVSKLHRMCLMLPSGRPLIASKGFLKEPLVPKKFHGHLSLDNIEYQRERAEMRNAVSTSHFAQSNTLEYLMAAEWFFLEKRSDLWWKALYEQHGKELDYFRSKFNSKVG